MKVRTKIIALEVKNIDLSELYDIYQAETESVTEVLADGQMAELVTTSTGAVSLIIHSKCGEVTEIKITKDEGINK